MAIPGTDFLEVPTIYKAYFLGLYKGIYPQNMAKNMVQYLHKLDPEIPIEMCLFFWLILSHPKMLVGLSQLRFTM